MSDPRPEAAVTSLESVPGLLLSRRSILRAGAVTGTGLVATALAACAPAAAGPNWTYRPEASSPVAAAPTSPNDDHAGHSATPTSAPAASASASPVDHDAAALAVVKRFLDGEGATLEGAGNQPIRPRLEGGAKVFEMTIDAIKHRIDADKDPIDALGYNGTWPAPRIEVTEGDTVRAVFKNNLAESTGVHFHGQRLPNNMDGVPHITQDPIEPGD